MVCAIFVTMCYGFLSLLVNDKEKRWQRVDMVIDKLAQDVGIVTSRGDPVEQFDVHKDQFKAGAALSWISAAYCFPRISYTSACRGALLCPRSTTTRTRRREIVVTRSKTP